MCIAHPTSLHRYLGFSANRGPKNPPFKYHHPPLSMAIWRVYPHPHHPLSVVAVFHIPRSNPDVSYPRTPLKVLDLHTVLRDEGPGCVLQIRLRGCDRWLTVAIQSQLIDVNRIGVTIPKWLYHQLSLSFVFIISIATIIMIVLLYYCYFNYCCLILIDSRGSCWLVGGSWAKILQVPLGPRVGKFVSSSTRLRGGIWT